MSWRRKLSFVWIQKGYNRYFVWRKVAVILIDTQETCGSQCTVKDCATVYALSTMLSSVQIYNFSQNIQEEYLQHLQLFTEYGTLALKNSGSTQFQKLHFLVWDWRYPYECDYGAVGGQQVLERRFRTARLKKTSNLVLQTFYAFWCLILACPLQLILNLIVDYQKLKINLKKIFTSHNPCYLLLKIWPSCKSERITRIF